ncbi:MAG: hypothetical protein JSW49_02120 [candidate division WOR-3 bacterium]|nr:MAG: hypothetical protein JSW49_02120 [candidate division WOR-3 bacterium]
MIHILLLLASSILWQENFTESTPPIAQLYDYHVDIEHRDGTVRLTANPQFEGFASAWLHVDAEITLREDDAIAMRVRGNDVTVRVRYFFRKGKCSSYYAGEKIVVAGAQWKDMVIPLEGAMFFPGTEFPAALTPGKSPVLYLFIENGESGNFDIEIGHIAIVRHDTQAEE